VSLPDGTRLPSPRRRRRRRREGSRVGISRSRPQLPHPLLLFCVVGRVITQHKKFMSGTYTLYKVASSLLTRRPPRHPSPLLSSPHVLT